jgi:hypothetical protein
MFRIEKGKKYLHPNKKDVNEVFNNAIACLKQITSEDESFVIPKDKLAETKISYFVSKLKQIFKESEGIKIVYLKEFIQEKKPDGKKEYTGVRFWRHEFNIETK